MKPNESLPSQPTESSRFRLHWDYRSPDCGRGRPVHGIQECGIEKEYLGALERAHEVLTGPECNWPKLPWPSIRVYIQGLRPGLFGEAHPAGYSGVGPALLLACGGSEPQQDWASQRRQAAAAHELTHLFLFEAKPLLGADWYFFDEAVATAMEPVVLRGNTDHFRFLYPWFMRPERSLDTTDNDRTAMCAAPFVTYLMNRFGRDVVRKIYHVVGHAAGGAQNPANTWAALTAVEQVLGQEGAVLADAFIEDDVFGSGYCVDAYFLDDPQSRLRNPGLYDRYDQRAVTETFCQYPVQDAAGNDPIDHLGCRYFRFRPNGAGSNLRVSVALPSQGAKKHLRGELVAVSPDGRRGEQRVQLQRTSDDGAMEAPLADFKEPDVDHAVLVVANCAWGEVEAGAPNRDRITFSISADVF